MKLYQRTCDNCQESCKKEDACMWWQAKVTEDHLDCLVKLQDIYRRNGKTYGAEWPIVKDLLGYGIIVGKDDWNKITYKLTYYGQQWVSRNPKLILLCTTHLRNSYTVRRITVGNCLDNILERMDRMHRLCDKIEAQFSRAAKMVEEAKGSAIAVGWHKLPPVPGWYASALTHHGQVEGMGINLFTQSKIRETDEQKNIWYYGPLPIWKIEIGKVETND